MNEKKDISFSPKAFGRYLLIERIGEGGMAEIFWAQAQGFGGFEKELVIKRILPQLSEDPEFVQMFLREANLAARLQHPNVVQNYDIGCEEGVYFIAMEYIEGITVKDMLSHSARGQQKLPVEMVVYLARQFLRGLAFVHDYKDNNGRRLGLVHRDITPSNVMLSRRGEVKIADFGVAKAQVGDLKTMTDSGTLKGKMGYLSPELIVGSAIDHRADVFAAGIVLYEMLTSRRLFKGSSDYNTLWMIQNGPIESLQRQRPDISELLERIVFRALERDPQKRYQTSSELAEDLDRLSQLEGMSFDDKDLSRWIEHRFGADLDGRRSKINSTLAISLGSLLGEQYEGEARGAKAGTKGAPPRGEQKSIRKSRAIWAVFAFLLGLVFLVLGIVEWRGQPGKGALLLTSVPPGAEIWLNEKRYPATTPQIIEGLQAGESYVLSLQLQGYESVEEAIQLENEERLELNIELEAHKKLDVQPLSKMKKGSGNKRPKANAAPGQGNLKPVQPKNEGAFKTIAPSAKNTTNPKTSAKAQVQDVDEVLMGTLFVNTRPWTEVFINGKSVGNTPLKNYSLKPGVYQVVLTNPDAAIYRQEKVEIKAGEQKRIVHRLQ